MKLFVDTNWLVAAYFPEKFPENAAVVEKFAARHDYPWFLSRPVLAECGNVFRHIAKESNPPQWIKLEEQIGEGISLSTDSWESICAKAEELFERFSSTATLGTLDMMILASALKTEATHFHSFDSNSNLRALAATLKLKVFPELTADDRRRMAAFR